MIFAVNWLLKGTGSECIGNRRAAGEGFCLAGAARHPDRRTGCLVCDEAVAGWLCIPDRSELDRISGSRRRHDRNCAANDQPAVRKGSNSKPCCKSEDGVRFLSKQEGRRIEMGERTSGLRRDIKYL
jgi:hypothetical protein